ncbi:MAG TPA: class I SAM-dependent methyltransferase [Patescibacteria group bacterium]
MTKTYSPDFANNYDTFIGGYSKQHKIVKKLIKKYHPTSKKLLEIACGTGNMLKAFNQTHTIYGLDISKDMINIAKSKLPKAKLYVKDMTNFNLKKKFDVVLCFYDAINHLISFKSWEKMFLQVSNHLDKNGIFIFDLTTMYRMIQRSKDPILVSKHKNMIITAFVTRVDKYTFKSRFQIIKKNDQQKWSCIEEYVVENCFEIEKVKKSLKKFFKIEEVFDYYQSVPTSKSKILFFICRKK